MEPNQKFSIFHYVDEKQLDTKMTVAIDLSRSESSNSQRQYESLLSSPLSSAEVREATELRQNEFLKASFFLQKDFKFLNLN